MTGGPYLTTIARRLAASAGLALGLSGAALAEGLVTLTVGGDSGLDKALRAASLLVDLSAEGTTDPQEVLAAAQADYARLIAVLYDAGRFGGVIRITLDGREAAAIPTLTPPAAVAEVQITVTPGPLYTFAAATIAPLAPGAALPGSFAPGQPAMTTVLRAAVSAATAAWRQTGHAKAAVAGQSLVADHAGPTLDAEIAIAPGPRVTFGPLIPEGFVRVRPERIVDIAGLPEGAVFDPDAIDTAAARLRRTGAFRAVAVTEAEALGPGATLPVTALVDEALPRRIGFGAEISSVDGLTLSGFWLHRNLFGGAERLRIEGEVAQIGAAGGGEDYSLRLEFGRPATFGPDTDLYATATVEQLNEPSYSSETAEVESGLIHIVTPRVTVQGGLGYRFSRITDAQGTETFRLLTLPLSVTYDGRDDAFDTARGVYADVALTPFVGLAKTDTGARLTFDTRAFRALGADDRVVLAGRLQGGSILGAAADRVPDDFLFFSGGGGTVRGQAYQSLGVPVAGVQTGGRSYLGVQAEARVKITDKLGAVAFYDWATVGADPLPGAAGDSHSGAGLGVRYQTPVGPVRLDLALPVTGPGAAEDVKIYIGIGQAF